MPQLTPQQRMYIKKRTKVHDLDPSELAGELNIIPFLDITVNLIMFLLMLTTTIAFFAQIEARLPTSARGGVGQRGQEGKTLNLALTLTENGVIVTGSGGKLAPGCEDVAAGRVVTVPKRNGQFDWEGLSACAVKLKDWVEKQTDAFDDDQQVTIGADPLIEFQYVVRAMDAMRSDGDRELFPDVLLSAGVR